MHPSLATLRQTIQPTPAKFLLAHPGCWIQYYDDTPAKDPTKALSAQSFDVVVARRKQQDRCAVCFSLQAFGDARTKQELLSFRNLGVDVDLASAEHRTLPREAIEARKEEYLARLFSFPLKPHWLIETGHGCHLIFRVLPQRHHARIREAAALNTRLVSALQGDENAALLTQVLRVPGTFQWKDPEHPFLCRLLIDNAGTIPPYELQAVRSVLDAWEVFHAAEKKAKPEQAVPGSGTGQQPSRWREGLNGVPEGQRNAVATSIVGAILGRLPEELWETAGWGGLKEWNGRNSSPLPEQELRAVFQSISRRERGKRQSGQPVADTVEAPVQLRIDVRIGFLDASRGSSSPSSGQQPEHHSSSPS